MTLSTSSYSRDRRRRWYIKAGIVFKIPIMSLPPAPKDISAHPQKGSVIDPVDKAAKEADVDRKVCLELCGTLYALTLRIDQAICYCTGSATITTPNEQTGRLMDRLRARQPTREHFDALERWTEARCGHSRDPQNAAQHDTGEERRRAHSRLDMADEGSRHIKRQSWEH